MMRYLHLVSLCFLILAAGCTGERTAVTSRTEPGKRYDSHFPASNVSEVLEKVSRSVKKVYSISSYTTWQFRREARITGYSLRQGSFKQAAWGVISTNETVFGTATLIKGTGRNIALLTCAHVVCSPDTIITWYEPEGDDPVACIRSLAVREKQENWVKDLTSCGSFAILAADEKEDIAIIGRHCESLPDTLYPLRCPAGRAKDLGWGSFVYIFGYPMGGGTVTTGIASPAAKRPMGEFTVDALLNKGCSGGVILAVRNGVPNLELVGMVKTVVSSQEDFLKPAPDEPQEADWLPYRGETFVGTGETIRYGLNAVVPVETIREFYRNHREELSAGGYNLDGYFGP